jgi:hypothetical protein
LRPHCAVWHRSVVWQSGRVLADAAILTRPVSRCWPPCEARPGAGAWSLTAHHGCTDALMIAQRFTSRLRRLFKVGPHCEDPAERVNRAPAVGPMHRNAVWRPAGDIFLFCSVVFRLAVGCMIILLCIFFGPSVYCVRRLLRKKPPDVETIFSNAMAGEEKILDFRLVRLRPRR